MQNYIGAKIVKAELGTLATYKQKKFGSHATIYEGDSKITGYIVYYPGIGVNKETYISWSPKQVFEEAYRTVKVEEITLLNS